MTNHFIFVHLVKNKQFLSAVLVCMVLFPVKLSNSSYSTSFAHFSIGLFAYNTFPVFYCLFVWTVLGFELRGS
jgi:hypothetical protein